jgi:hypothetical protein
VTTKHGYLLSQFLSPRVNTRTDAYGGAALESRARIVFDIIAAIRAAVPDPRFMLAIKMNSHDFIEGGFDADDARTMARALDAAGVDLIELSGGTYEDLRLYHKQESTRRREAFFIECVPGCSPGCIRLTCNPDSRNASARTSRPRSSASRAASARSPAWSARWRMARRT